MIYTLDNILYEKEIVCDVEILQKSKSPPGLLNIDLNNVRPEETQDVFPKTTYLKLKN